MFRRKSILLKFIFSVALVLIIRYLFGPFYYDADERYINGGVSFLLLVIAIDSNSIFNLEYKWLKYLGKISFGIYIFHIIGVYLSLKTLNLMGLAHQSITFWVCFPLFASVYATSIAILSYEYFEKYFLNLKNKFK